MAVSCKIQVSSVVGVHGVRCITESLADQFAFLGVSSNDNAANKTRKIKLEI
jgi:hypothetical protein